MPSPASIRLSVALVTRNRPASLDRCLQSLRAQSASLLEIVVSDDSTVEWAEETQRVAARWQARYINGPRAGLYANRNCAARACLGTHLRTVDDDHTFSTDHFAQTLDAVAGDPQAVWTLGEASFLGERALVPARTANQLHASGVGSAVEDLDNNWSIADGSTIYPRSVFDRGFFMVEQFGYGSSYLEFGAYLYARGFRSRCLVGPLLEHHMEEATLHRGQTPAAVASRIFASFCFNLYFRPDPFRASRYLVSALASAAFNLRLLRRLPRLLLQAEARWGV